MAYDIGMNADEFNKRMSLLRNFMSHAVKQEMKNLEWIEKYPSEDEANKALRKKMSSAFDGKIMLSR